MLPSSTRTALALVVLVVGVLVQLAVKRRGRIFGVECAEPSERDRGWTAGVRVGAGGLGLGAIGIVKGATLPLHVLAATGVGALAPPLLLAMAAWRMRARHEAAPTTAWPRLVSVSHHLVNGAVVAVGAILFSWMLPKLPTIIPLHWAPLGDSGYGSPTKLWWSLSIVAVNTAIMVLAARQLSGESEQPRRRVALLRFTETLLVGFDVAVVILWLGVAASGRPSVQLLRPALIAAGTVVGLAVLVALIGNALSMLSRRPNEEGTNDAESA